MSTRRILTVSRQLPVTEPRWRTVLLVGLVLVIGSLLPSPLARRPEFRRIGPDKFLHLVGHAGFTAVLTEALVADGVDGAGAGSLAVGGSVALGLLVGYLQRYVPGRVPERADLVAGVIGSVGGAVGWWYQSETASG